MPIPKRILMLEDDAVCAALAKERINNHWKECDIVHVTNKDDYTSALAGEGFDVILSDYCMPGFSGPQALAQANKECPEVPFLFVSGTISDDVAVESLRAGAVDYILKDRPARLIPAINRALDMAEAASRRIEHEALVNSVDGIVWVADQSTLQFLFVSQQTERILGYPIESWISEPDFWQQHIHPDDREMAVNVCRHLTPEETHPDFEYRMIAADGRIVWLRDIVNVRIRKNQPPQIQGIMMDVTRQKAAEEQVKDVQSKLEATNHDLVRRNQEIQNFYHVLSHELKTPLTSAREFVSMVMEGLAGPLNRTQLEYLGIAKDSCNQLRVCVNDLLDTTRIETGKLSLKFTSVDLKDVIDRIVKSQRAKAVEHNVHLDFEPPSDLAVIAADENRINQVVTNLIDNAFKFTPSGGIIAVKITGVFGRPDYLQVSISDTGCGIPKEELDCIFERLHQIKAGDATKEHGIGLGLYLCRELVWLHGGVIWVNSQVGKGSIFTFVLPRSQKKSQTEVLIIDDDADLLETTKLMLENEYQVRTALDGAEGIKEMRRKLPDIVIMDLSMPNVDGVELLRTVRENWDSVPIIVHTAYSNGNLMKQAMEYSPFTLLSKPSDMSSLLRAVRCVSLGIEKGADDETRIVDRTFFFDQKTEKRDRLTNGERPLIQDIETS
jgi:PAS domain S-box-containing protein